MSFTVTTAIVRIRSDLRDSGTNKRWSDDTILDYLGDGVKEMVGEAPSVELTVTPDYTSMDGHTYSTATINGAAIAAADATFDTSSSAFKLRDFWYNGLPLRQTTLEAEDIRNTSWRDLSGTPERYIVYRRGADGIVDSALLIRLIPAPVDPQSDTTRAAIIVGGDTLSRDNPTGNFGAVPSAYHHYLVDYVLWRCLSRDGDETDKKTANEYHLPRWLYGVKMAKEYLESDSSQQVRYTQIEWM